jgi:hypothetical protein
LIAIGILVGTLGAIIMINVMYLPFYDPVTLIVFTTVWAIGEILSVLVSFIEIKFKLYEKKPVDPMR